MKIELDEHDKANLEQGLMKYAYELLKEETEKIIKEQFRLLCLSEFRKIARETVESILEKEKIDLAKILHQRLLTDNPGYPALRQYSLENIVRGFVNENLDKHLPILLEKEKGQLAVIFEKALSEIFTSEIKKKMGIFR